MRFFVWVVLSVFGVRYLSDILRLDPENKGPFQSNKDRVIFYGSYDNGDPRIVIKRVDLFDRLRFLTGVYDVSSDDPDDENCHQTTWEIRPNWQADLWSCARCLSLWVSGAVLVVLLTPFRLLTLPFIIAGLIEFVDERTGDGTYISIETSEDDYL